MGLADSLVEQDHTADVLADVLSSEEELSVGLAVGFRVLDADLSMSATQMRSECGWLAD